MDFNKNEEEENNLSLARFESMLKTNKILFFDSEEFENIILHYLDSGKVNLAKKALKLALDQHPTSIGLKLVEVEILIFQNKLEAADRLLDEIEHVEPHNDEIYIHRASIYSKKGNHLEAISALEKALTITEDLADIYSLLGMEYLFIDEIEKAKQSFILCLDNDDEDQSTLYNIVYCFDFLNEIEEAIDYLNSFIDKNPYSEIAWHQLGRQYYALKNYEKAVWAFNYATLIDEQFLGAYLEKGKSLEKLQQHQEAIDNYMITLELDAPSSYVLLRIGICYEALNNFPLAIQYYKKTVHEDPMLDKGWIALTDIYIKESQFDKALVTLQKAIQIDELNERYWVRYAVLNRNLLQFKEAELGYRKATELGEYILDYWIDWADILYLLEEYEDAIDKLYQIESTHPNTAEIYYRLAVFHLANNNSEEALVWLEQGLTTDAEKVSLIANLFHTQWENPILQQAIKDFTK
ncbi:tetratricopeptide repeat protein [Myroides sp. DF42-4-2]|uniref:tetratricopeptide repeat protein n=1 Tax=unclassified Myroides TaxID=2642485 RepID=UPI0025788F90|nr:tetratricopeptide repeat protein [Myroides sp. DF42-4-2]MDM1407095.1 tetratricopeptide repeat protein [Myroides sp. DF42-4-2]